jgi:hypothetical protein
VKGIGPPYFIDRRLAPGQAEAEHRRRKETGGYVSRDGS